MIRGAWIPLKIPSSCRLPIAPWFRIRFALPPPWKQFRRFSLPPPGPACGWLIDMETGRQGIRTRIPPSRINGLSSPPLHYPDLPKDRSSRRFPDNLKSFSTSPPPVINYASFKSWFSSIQGLRNDYTRVYTRVLGWKWRVTDSNLTRESYFPREIFEISRLQKRIRLLIISGSVLSKYRSDCYFSR